MLTLFFLVLTICLAMSFLLSGMEAGVFSISRLRVRHLVRAGDKRAIALHRYLDNPETFLWTILVGNTISSVTAATLGVIGLSRWLYEWPVFLWSGFAVSGLLFYAVCELFPKMLFRTYPNRLCLALARPFRVIDFCLRPIVALTDWLANNLLRWSGGRSFTGHLFGNRQELRLLMQESAQGLTSEERIMINRVLDLQNIAVREITAPMSEVVSVPLATPVHEILALCRERGFSRLPVRHGDGSSPRIVGLVTLTSLIYEDTLELKQKTAGDFLEPAIYLDQDLRLELALRQMQRAGQRLAVVLAQDRSELGVASLEDILKVIFGEVKL